ncbi:MAG: MBL fold metallo-hydrolase [Methanomassiliicoccales archaeon]|jgi:glyoxylase-like metal-dependent hydrolase (beta-lactamase superfamily II)|nr:MBL fold metallo-hydrolase [Methanomassiliicoccales archaeon]
MTPRVSVLCEGTIRRDGKTVLEAHSSSTLVMAGNEVIVVDTSSREYRERLIEGLARVGLRPTQVTMLVSTHLHQDHHGNDDLFPQARKVSVSGEGEVGEGFLLAEGVTLVRTPGHTMESASVFVEAERRYAITGDAIPIRDNVVKWVPPGLRYDEDLAMRSMRLIVDFAEVIVPGHGAPFELEGISTIGRKTNGKGDSGMEG